MPPLSRVLPPFTLIIAAIVFGIAVMPAPPHIASSDKVEHMLAFATITLLASLSWPETHWFRRLLWIAAYGALIEVTQMIPMLNRTASVADWIADMCATSAMLLVALSVRKALVRMTCARTG